jgi:oligopeptide/dipeptide ABC transporter ATP-binding protein
MMEEEPVLNVDGLSIAYELKMGAVRAVDNVSMSIKPHELVAAVGESGCGKTTLGLSIIGLLPIPPAEYVGGKVEFNGKNLLDLAPDEMRLYRGTEIAMIFQEPMTSLNPVFKVGNQIQEAIKLRDSRGKGSATSRRKILGSSLLVRADDKKKQIVDVLNLVRIPDPERVVDRYPFELSGGMRQRVMIGMALAQKPSLLIADEPTTALDVTTQAQVLKLMRGLMEEVDTSILLITHDLAVASQVADRIAVMYAGQIVEDGEVLDMFSHPLHPYTQGLLACIPSGSKEGTKLKPIEGNAPDLRSIPKACKFAPRCPYVMKQCVVTKPELTLQEGSHRVACYLY